jgi:hypothetical protein
MPESMFFSVDNYTVCNCPKNTPVVNNFCYCNLAKDNFKNMYKAKIYLGTFLIYLGGFLLRHYLEDPTPKGCYSVSGHGPVPSVHCQLFIAHCPLSAHCLLPSPLCPLSTSQCPLFTVLSTCPLLTVLWLLLIVYSLMSTVHAVYLLHLWFY